MNDAERLPALAEIDLGCLLAAYCSGGLGASRRCRWPRRAPIRGAVRIGCAVDDAKASHLIEGRPHMTTKPFILKPGDRPPALNAIGVQITVLASEGAIEDQQVTIQAGPEGSGPPPHSHDWDETFYVISGQVDFVCAGEAAACSAGTLVHVPAGTVHAFSFGPGGGEMFEITGKRSTATAAFTALDREIPPGPPDLAKAIGVLAANGVNVHT